MSILFSNFAVRKEIIYMNKTKYIYKGQDITHTAFISLCRKAGLLSGNNKNQHSHIIEQAFKGNSKAVEILNELQVINPNEKEIFDHADEI